jgi:hypothetical protein
MDQKKVQEIRPMMIECGPCSGREEDDMESMRFDRERGQILVQVAILVAVLFAFVALSLDGGSIYAGRRRMQNAADAGALAGAREICFGEHDDLAAAHTAAEAAAHEYAEDRNGSEGADVDIVGDYTVTVVASQTLDTFFAGIIGINTAHVRAEAAAVCGPLVSGGGTWPLAFDWSIYTDVLTCGQQFLVFDDALDCAGPDDECEDCSGQECNKLDCGLISDPYMETGNYGWLDFPDPGEEYLPDYYKPGTCGGSGEGWMECWVRYNYPPLLEIGQCILTEHGMMTAVGDSANARAGRLDLINPVQFDDAEIEDPFVNVILWEEWCDANQDQIRIAGFGCIEVIAYYDRWEIPKCSGQNSTHKVIVARRICPNMEDEFENCRSYTGSGAPGGDSESWGISLIR